MQFQFLLLQCFLYRFADLFSLEGLLHYIAPLNDLGLLFVDHLSHYLSACFIRHFSKSFVSCGSQGSTVQVSSSHKCNQEVWRDELNMVAATIHSVTSRLTSFSKIFLYSMTSYNNMPLTWPYYPRV